MEIKVTVSRNAGDLNKAFKASLQNNSKQPQWLRIGFYILSAIFFLNYVYASRNNLLNKDLIQWILLIALSILFWLGMMYYMRTQMGGRMLKKNPTLSREETLVISDEGLHSTTATGEGKTKWSNYIKAVITKEIILLYQNNSVFLCYPKRVFTEQEYADFSELIRKNITETKIL